MGLFNKKKKQSEYSKGMKCPVEGCSFECDDQSSMEKHVAWKHPQLAKTK